MNLPDLLPDTWRNRSGRGLVSAYRMIGRSADELNQPRSVDLVDTCVLIARIPLPRLKLDSNHVDSKEGGININITGGSGEPREPEGTMLFLTKLDIVDSPETDLNLATIRINEAVSLVSTILGLTCVHEHIEDYEYLFESGKLGPRPVRIFDPLWYTKLSLDENAIDILKRNSQLVKDHEDKDLITLSMRWFDEVKRCEGVDAFLKMWISVETLVMKGGSDLESIDTALSSVYEITSEESRKKFKIDNICKLRCDIVHDGSKAEISREITSYLSGIYLDLLSYKLDAEKAYFAQKKIEEHGSTILFQE